MGDGILCTPALATLKKQYPKHKVILYCTKKHHVPVFQNNPNIDSLRFLSAKTLWRYPYHLFAYVFKPTLVNYISLAFQHVGLYEHIYKRSVKEIVGDIFGLTVKDLRSSIYLTEAEDKRGRELLAPFQNVVIMHINSSIAPNHHWILERWTQLVKELPEYTFIQLGLPAEEQVPGAIDWRGKTTLREAFSIIKHATSFVGVDAGLSHVTNAFDIPGVVLFGDSNPIQWGHDNNINLYKKTACSPCYFYLWKERCPYDHACMEAITVDDVKSALRCQVARNLRA